MVKNYCLYASVKTSVIGTVVITGLLLQESQKKQTIYTIFFVFN